MQPVMCFQVHEIILQPAYTIWPQHVANLLFVSDIIALYLYVIVIWLIIQHVCCLRSLGKRRFAAVLPELTNVAFVVATFAGNSSPMYASFAKKCKRILLLHKYIRVSCSAGPGRPCVYCPMNSWEYIRKVYRLLGEWIPVYLTFIVLKILKVCMA